MQCWWFQSSSRQFCQKAEHPGWRWLEETHGWIFVPLQFSFSTLSPHFSILDLFTDIHNYYGNDPQLGLVNVCKWVLLPAIILKVFSALNAFINELNGKNIDIGTCFDPLFILKNEDVPDEALSFLGVVGALRFQCGAGLYREPVLNFVILTVFSRPGKRQLEMRF